MARRSSRSCGGCCGKPAGYWSGKDALLGMWMAEGCWRVVDGCGGMYMK